MPTQHAHEFLEGLQPGTHGRTHPFLQVIGGPFGLLKRAEAAKSKPAAAKKAAPKKAAVKKVVAKRAAAKKTATTLTPAVAESAAQ
jgi:hypothetical protein